MFEGFVDPDDAPYLIYLKMQKYIFILGQPHLKVLVSFQRLVLRARRDNVALFLCGTPWSSRTLCQPANQVQKYILARCNIDPALMLCIRSQLNP
jgi:hypothetical protein